MKQAQDPEVRVSEGEELDAGWDEPSVPSIPVSAAVGARAAVGPSPLPVPLPAPDDIDEGWDDDEDDHAVAAVSAPLRAKPGAVRSAPMPVGGPVPARRALSKKERRELERQTRVQAKRRGEEHKETRRLSRREEARRLAEQRQQERVLALAAAKKKARQAKKASEQARVERAAAEEDEPPPSSAQPTRGTKRQGGKAPRTKGRLKKQTGGGLIIAIIALITLATALYAWSKR
jgi:hypothetical protein